MIIRKANINDLSKVYQLFCSYLEFYKRQIDQSRALNFLKERLTQNDSVIFLVEENGVASGFVQLYPCFSSLSQSRTWILNDLFVDSNMRGNGMGQKLTEAAVEFSKHSGATSLSLQTATDNFSAQRLYEKLGWVRDNNYLTFSFTF